jgi:uncharacterized protein (TIGR02996 family)
MPRSASATTEDAFLQSILSNPDDDMPRLVYADWLEEQGNPRGAFIRLQCQRARLTRFDAGWKELLSQESALLKEFEVAWSEPIKRLVDAYGYHRGFIEHVRVTASKLLKNGARLFRLAPVRSVMLDQADRLAELSECAWLAGVRELDMSVNPLGRKSLQSLLRSAYLGALESLTLDRCMLTVEMLQDLATNANLGRLRSLSVAGCSVGAAGAQVLMAGIWLTSLKELDLRANDLQRDGAHALAASSALRLTRLEIGGNRIGNSGIAPIAEAPQFSDLRQFGLHDNEIGNLGVEALVQSPSLAQLEHLNLSRNHVSGRGVQLLAESALLSNLISLSLRNNEIDKATLQTVPQRLQGPKMRELAF